MVSDMQSASQFLIALGGILLLGLVTDALGRRTHLPRVTLLLIFGVIIGKDLLDIIPAVFSDRFEIIADMALLMVGFLLGGKLTADTFRNSAGQILWISISAAIVTTAMVSTGLVLVGVSAEIAVLLGCIASATAPAAVLDVVTESNYKGPFSNLLLSIVSLDDAWALLLFGIGIVAVKSMTGIDADVSPIFTVLIEALVAAEHFPEYRQTLLSVIISTTIFFEIIGPVFTRMALQRTRNA